MIFTILFIVAGVIFVFSMFADEAARWPLWFIGAGLWVGTFIVWTAAW